MNSYGGKELAAAFRTVRKNTIQVAEDLPESKYEFVAAPDCRSVAQMLTHIAIATRIWEDIHKTKRLNTLVAYDFLGLVGPEGRHRVEFAFRPWSLRLGPSVSWAALALALVLFGGLFVSRRQRHGAISDLGRGA